MPEKSSVLTRKTKPRPIVRLIDMLRELYLSEYCEMHSRMHPQYLHLPECYSRNPRIGLTQD